MPELFYLLNEVMANTAIIEQLEKHINLYDETAEEQSHKKVFFLSLESKYPLNRIQDCVAVKGNLTICKIIQVECIHDTFTVPFDFGNLVFLHSRICWTN